MLPSDIKKAKIDKGVDVTQQEMIHDLQGIQVPKQEIKDLAPHIKAGALALNGHYGKEVTLVGIDPHVLAVMIGNRKFDGFDGDMHISPNTVHHPLSFLGMDGVVEEDQFAENNVNDGYGDFPQTINTMPNKELEKKEKALKVTLARAQARRMDQQQQHGHGGQQQQQQQHNHQGPNFEL